MEGDVTKPVQLSRQGAARKMPAARRATAAHRVSPSGAALAVAAAVALSGCATAIDLAGLPHVGAQPDGTYVLAPEEKSLACRDLGRALTLQIDRAKSLAKAVPDEAKRGPKNVKALIGQMSGWPNGGLKSLGDYDKTKARAAALNGEMVRKGCPPVDLDAELKEADALVAIGRGRPAG